MSAPSEILVHRTPAYRFVRDSVNFLLRTFCGLEVHGRENLPLHGRVVLVSNHQSFLDIPIVAAAAGKRHVAFVARDSLANSKPLAWLMRQCGAVLVRRGQADRRALKDMIAHLEMDDILCVFPEGTRSVDGSIGEFRGGALIAARRARAPVVPVAIDGAFGVWPRGQKLPRPGKIHVRFGEPLDGTTNDALDRVRGRVAELLDPSADTSESLETRTNPSLPSPAADATT